MKTIKIISFATALMTLCGMAQAELMEVYTWKAFPGKSSQMVTNFIEAKKLHEEAGASVSIVQRMTGSTQEVDYIMRWDDTTSWGSAMDKSRSPSMMQKWQKFLEKANIDPSGEMVASVTVNNIDVSQKASDFKGSLVYGAWAWNIAPGRTADFIKSAMDSKAIHESLGARVEVYQESFGGTGKIHYVMVWDSYTDMADSMNKMSTNKAWTNYLSERDATLSTLANAHRGQTLISH